MLRCVQINLYHFVELWVLKSIQQIQQIHETNFVQQRCCHSKHLGHPRPRHACQVRRTRIVNAGQKLKGRQSHPTRLTTRYLFIFASVPKNFLQAFPIFASVHYFRKCPQKFSSRRKRRDPSVACLSSSLRPGCRTQFEGKSNYYLPAARPRGVYGLPRSDGVRRPCVRRGGSTARRSAAPPGTQAVPSTEPVRFRIAHRPTPPGAPRPDHAARPSPRGCARMPEGVLCTRGGEIRNATP